MVFKLLLSAKAEELRARPRETSNIFFMKFSIFKKVKISFSY